MTTATAADYLDCSVRQVQRLCQSRILAALFTRKGGRLHWNVNYASVRRYRRIRLRRDLA